MDSAWLTIGRISKPHGVRGEVSVYPMTDFLERFFALKRVRLVSEDDQEQWLEVERCRIHKNRVLLKWIGLDSVNQVESLRGFYLTIPLSERFDLPEDHYYVFELIGATLVTEQGDLVGTLQEVWNLPGNDVYVVAGPDGQVLIPAVKEIVVKIDLNPAKIWIRPIPGLLDAQPPGAKGA